VIHYSKKPVKKLTGFLFLLINILMNKETKTLQELKEDLEKLNTKKEFVKKALKLIDNQRATLHMKICTHEKF